MKKQLTYTSALLAVTLASVTGVVVTNNTNANSGENESVSPQITNTISENLTRKFDDKNEMVYVTAGANGAVKNTFIGSTLYDGKEALPFDMKVTYYLDGKEVSAKDLAGKSGRVKIIYSYQSKATYGGKYVPFMAITELGLDGEKFDNVRVSNGKIISEGENYIITGYSFLGLNADLKTDFLPTTFIVEADAKDFSLGNSYTILTNELIANIDTSKLTNLDELVSSINQLSDGLDKIIDGSSEIKSGLEKSLAGTKKLYAGAGALANGINDVTNGASRIAGGLNEISSHNNEINAGADQIFAAMLSNANKELSASFGNLNLTVKNYSTTLDNLISTMTTIGNADAATSLTNLKTQLNTVQYFCTNLKNYTDGVARTSAGANELRDGLNTINGKTPELVAGLGSLVDGTTKLYEGSVTLNNGLNTFKSSGIDKLVDFANNDMASFIENARGTVKAASSYHSFGGSNAKTVKFIVKTTSIKN